MPVNQEVQPENEKTAASSAEPSQVDRAYEQILLSIVRGEIAGGAELKSTQLAGRLGVSRTPVVQALQRLAADGIVHLEANKRAMVRPGAERWLLEIHEMRELLEPFAAARAAGAIPSKEIAYLRGLADAAKPGHTPNWAERAQEFDFALHLAIAQHAGNFVLGDAIRKCWEFKRISYLALPERAEALAQGYGEHLAILAALERGDAETARAAMLFHLRSAGTLRPAKTIV
jgi:DNA-binding GntR family transcriptional regulator